MNQTTEWLNRSIKILDILEIPYEVDTKNNRLKNLVDNMDIIMVQMQHGYYVHIDIMYT
jgi:hypothetical protein